MRLGLLADGDRGLRWAVTTIVGLISVAESILAQGSSSPGVIRGVNIGGWLLTEEWITPSVYTSGGRDEWTMCNNLGKSACLSNLQNHWSTFYTKDDFTAIKAAGLNSVRIPIGYWAVDILPYEPYVSGQYPYLIQAVYWAQELGLTVQVDLHGVPGSQNGQDNSGLTGPVLFQVNSTNFDRSLLILQNFTTEFSKEIYGGVVKSIELLNEPRVTSTVFTMTELKSYYTAGMNAVRSLNTGSINVTIHDAFYGPNYWASYSPVNTAATVPATHLTLDTHQYYAFAPLNNLPHDIILQSICNISQILKSPSAKSKLPPVVVGEWSLETGSAPNSSSSIQNSQDTQDRRTWFRLLFEAQLAAYSPNGPGQPSIGWYFWTWKTQTSIDTWSYNRGLRQGYIPSDVSNKSTLAYPLLDNGCVDAGFNYIAPLYVSFGIRSIQILEMSWILMLIGLLLVGSLDM